MIERYPLIKSSIPLPLYYKLKQSILTMIDNEELMPDQLIPSERELIEIHQISRTTVRKAIEELVNEGHLYKIHGKGTFVKGRRFAQGLINLTSCGDSLRDQGFNIDVKLLDSGIIEPSNLILHNLHLQKGEKVFLTKRVFYGDDDPINFATSYIPLKFVRGIEKHDFSQESLYKTLEGEFNVKILKADRTIEAVLASENERNALKVEKKHPLLKFTGWVYGHLEGMEKLIEYFVSYYRSDRSKFYIEQNRV